MPHLLPLALALAAASPTAGEEPERGAIHASDLRELRQITAVEVAPDGRHAVYAVRSVHVEGTDPGAEAGDRTHLWVVGLEGTDARPVQLTFGKRSDGDPRISPDGRWLAFVRRAEDGPKNGSKKDPSARADDGPRPQVWLLPLRGPGEARQLTHLEHGASAPRWQPDGAALVVSSSVPAAEIEGAPRWDPERPRRAWRDTAVAEEDEEGASHAHPDGDRDALRRWLAANAEERDPNVITRLAFQGEQALRGEQRFAQLFLVDVDGVDVDGQAEPRRLSGGFEGYRGAAFSPDGRTLALVGPPPGDEHPDRVRRSSLYLLDVDGNGGARVLLDDPAYRFGSPVWSPDGGHLFLTRRAVDEPLYRQTELCRVRADGTGLESWSAAWDGSVSTLRAWRDGAVFTSNRHGATRILSAAGGAGPTGVYGGPGTIGALDAVDDGGPGGIVCAIGTAENPCELYALEAGGAPRRLTNLHGDFLEEHAVSLPSEHWIEREDGVRVQYWVMEPTGLEEGERYPCVLAIHGGPHVMWGPGTFSMWHEFQLLCSWGYGVVYANPRGSSGYGYAHQRGNYRDWGTGPAGDVLAALDDAVASHAWIDPERLVVTGGSYAGYLTAWIVAHDHRFQAAVAQRGVYDLVTFFGEGNAWRLVEMAFGGFPWDDEVRAVLTRESPFTHVDQIETPLLVMHASRDLRTGVSQSEMLYRALKELERPVEYVRYPDTGHDLSRTGDPLQRMDRLNRIVEFFERWVENPRPAPVESAPEDAESGP